MLLLLPDFVSLLPESRRLALENIIQGNLWASMFHSWLFGGVVCLCVVCGCMWCVGGVCDVCVSLCLFPVQKG